MAVHKASVAWERGDADFKPGSYSQDHAIDFGAGRTLDGSASPDYRGDPDRVDPEQTFAASIAACHMLTFLALAAAKGFTVESYSDEAVAEVGKNDQGRMAVTRVTLRPRIAFAAAPDAAALEGLHERAHKACFVANAVSCPVDVEAP